MIFTIIAALAWAGLRLQRRVEWLEGLTADHERDLLLLRSDARHHRAAAREAMWRSRAHPSPEAWQ